MHKQPEFNVHDEDTCNKILLEAEGLTSFFY